VLVCKFGLGCAHQGVQSVVYPPGSTNFFAPLVRDFYTFDTKVQNLRMSAKNAADGTGEGNDLQFKTTDGSDVSMDVTVVWGIDAQMAPSLLEMVGKDTEEVKEKLVRPMARTIVRDVLNRLDSESIYNADKRFQGAEEAQRQLATALTPYGVLVSQVILHEHRFPPEYEKIIHDRKLAEQRAEQLKSEAEAAQQEALRDLEGRPRQGRFGSRPGAGRSSTAPNSRRTRGTTRVSRSPRPSWPNARPRPRPSPSATRPSAVRAVGRWSSSASPRPCRANRSSSCPAAAAVFSAST
jgi:hypothetical protein